MVSRTDVFLLAAALLTAMLLRMALTPVFVPDREREFDAKVEYRGLSDNLMVVQPPQSVKLMASGASDDLDQLDTESVLAVIDLSQAKPGVRSYPLTVSGPTGSRLDIAARFGAVKLDVQRIETLDRIVTLEQSGLPPSAYVVEGGTIDPPSVTIFGPEKALPLVRRVRVILNLADVRPGGSYMLPVEILDEKGKPVPTARAQPSQVAVNPAVAVAALSKRVLVSPEWRGQPPFGSRVVGFKVRPTQVQVRGESGTLSGFVTVATEPIDLAQFNATKSVKARLNLPNGVRAIGTSEVEVTVEIEASAPTEAEPAAGAGPTPSGAGGQ